MGLRSNSATKRASVHPAFGWDQRYAVSTGSCGSRGKLAVMRSAASADSSSASGRKTRLDTLNTLEFDDSRLDPVGGDLQDPCRRARVAPEVARNLEPRPFEPAGVLPEARGGGGRVPLVHPARVEDEPVARAVDEGAVGVPEDDHVGGRELAAQ